MREGVSAVARLFADGLVAIPGRGARQMFGLTHTFGALYLATLLMQFGATLLITYLALRLNSEGLAEFLVGALMAANALGMVLGGKAGHFLIARVGHVRTFVACAGLIVAAVLAHGFSSALPFWLLLRCLVGLAMMCQLVVLESWLNERAPTHQRGGVLALYMIASYVGMMLGQLSVSFNGDLGVDLLLVVAIAFSLCLVPVALTRGAHPAVAQPTSIALGLLLRRVPQSLMTVLMSGMLNGSFYGLSGIYAKQQGLDTAEVGQFLALTIGTGLLAQIPLGLISDYVPRASLIRRIAFLLVLACLPLGFLQGLPFAALLFFGVCIGGLQFCLYPLGAALANERIEPAMRVPLAATLLTIFGAGSFISPLLAGFLMEHFGASSLYCFFAGCAALLALSVNPRKISGELLSKEASLAHQTHIELALQPRRKLDGRWWSKGKLMALLRRCLAGLGLRCATKVPRKGSGHEDMFLPSLPDDKCQPEGGALSRSSQGHTSMIKSNKCMK